MVDQFEGCEFWLPPEFLNDDDFCFDFKESRNNVEVKKESSDLFSGSNSEMGTPTESESDEDDYVNGLACKMANSTLDGKACRLPTSPKSPLCKAAGEFSRRIMVHESTGLPPDPKVVYPMNHPPQLSYQKMQEIRQYQFRRHQMMIHSQENRGVKNDARNPMGLPVSVWPPLYKSQPQPQALTGMRTVFSGPNPGGVKKQCAGTGVFLPRTVSSPGNCKKKPGCSSPVLTPDRVAQALNLNLETLAVQKQAHPIDYGTGLKYNNRNKKNLAMVQRRQSVAEAVPENQDVIRLLPEWTY